MEAATKVTSVNKAPLGLLESLQPAQTLSSHASVSNHKTPAAAASAATTSLRLLKHGPLLRWRTGHAREVNAVAYDTELHITFPSEHHPQQEETRVYRVNDWIYELDMFCADGLRLRVRNKRDPSYVFYLWPKGYNRDELFSWQAAIRLMCTTVFLQGVERAQINAVAELRRHLESSGVRLDDFALYRFLKEHDFEIETTKQAIYKNQSFLNDAHLDKIHSVSVYDLLKIGLATVPGCYDKLGRPIVFFHAVKHRPGERKFIETFKLVLYLIKVASSLCVSNQEIIIIEQLEGTTKENEDTRLVKFIVEAQRSHFPQIVGDFYSVNCTWYYPVLVALIKPWLSKDLARRLHAYTSASPLEDHISKDMLPLDLGGKVPVDLDAWISLRISLDGFSVEDIHHPELSKHEFGENVLAVYDDKPANELKLHARKFGPLKKKGNWVQLTNDRFVILTDKVLYYYKEPTDSVAEGAILLADVTVSNSHSTFILTSPDGKVNTFVADNSKEAAEWTHAIEAVCRELGQGGHY